MGWFDGKSDYEEGKEQSASLEKGSLNEAATDIQHGMSGFIVPSSEERDRGYEDGRADRK